MSTYTDGDPLHHHTSLIQHDGIHHIKLFLEDNGSSSMSYKSGIGISVTLILEAFEYVSFKYSLDYKMSAWKLCSLPCFTLVVDIVP
jgi:hypothetical protein